MAKSLITLHQDKSENSSKRKSPDPNSRGVSKLPPPYRKEGSKRHWVGKLLEQCDPLNHNLQENEWEAFLPSHGFHSDLLNAAHLRPENLFFLNSYSR